MMQRDIIIRTAFWALLSILCTSCKQPQETKYTYPVGPTTEVPDTPQDPDNPENPDKPDEPDNPEPPVVSKPKYLWVDAAANSFDLSNSKENIKRDLGKAKDVGFTDIVVDVRPSNGDVMFKTDKCSQATKFGFWFPGGRYGIVERTATWDYLQAFIDIGHELGLRIHAGFNTFVGGNSYGYGYGSHGVLFRDASKKDWATVVNIESGLTNVMDIPESQGYTTKFFNPANDKVQEYIIGLLRNLASYKDLDGIILDRGRYNDITSDFSDISRKKFEKYYGKKVASWPNDIFAPGTTLSKSPSEIQKKWLEFRSATIREFMRKARTAVKEVNPKLRFGVYVGGWYSTYFDVGVNWASPKFKPNYYWASNTYNTTGYADLMDQMLIGAYASPGRVYGLFEWTMQGFCKLAHEKIKGDCPIVAGGPDVGNWDYENKFTQEQENEAITKSVKACMNACDGYFLFDMCHLRSADQWQYVKAGM